MKRMSTKLIILMSLTLLGSVAMPTFASAWETERPPLGGKGIYSYGSELFKESELFRESRDNEKGSQSSSDSLSPSADLPPSVHGHTGGVDRPFSGGSPSAGDPAVQDLSRMDGGGFSSPGSSWGSVPGYHGR